MRASRAPGSLASALRASLDHRRESRRRRLQIVAPALERGDRWRGVANEAPCDVGAAPVEAPGGKAERGEDGGGRHRHARIGQHGEQRRELELEGQAVRLAPPFAARAAQDRPARRRRPRRRLHSRRSSSAASPFACASARRAAAASLEPPPIPAATGRYLRKWKRPSRRPGRRVRRALRPRARRDCPAAAPTIARSARRSSAKALARLETEPVAAPGEGDEAVEFMPAVGAARREHAASD